MPFAQFLIGLFLLLLSSFESTLYVLGNSPLSETWFANIFSPSIAFILFTGSFEEQTSKFLVRSNLLFVFCPFASHAFGVQILCLALDPEDHFSQKVLSF